MYGASVLLWRYIVYRVFETGKGYINITLVLYWNVQHVNAMCVSYHFISI